MADLTYITNGMFTRFVPHTRAGEDAYRQLSSKQNFSVAAVLECQTKECINALRKAGYTVKKHKFGQKPTKQEIDELLEELN